MDEQPGKNILSSASLDWQRHDKIAAVRVYLLYNLALSRRVVKLQYFQR